MKGLSEVRAQTAPGRSYSMLTARTTLRTYSSSAADYRWLTAATIGYVVTRIPARPQSSLSRCRILFGLLVARSFEARHIEKSEQTSEPAYWYGYRDGYSAPFS